MSFQHITFAADICGTPTNVGVQYNPPFTGSFSVVDQILNNCCYPFKLKRLAQPVYTSTEAYSAFLFPNPNNGKGFSLKGENIAKELLYKCF